MTLYRLSGEQAGKFICTSTVCLQNWHPLTMASGAKPSGSVGSLGVVKRPGGSEQVTYKGMPLYTFAQDHAPGQAKGQGLKDVGTWNAISGSAAKTSSPAGDVNHTSILGQRKLRVLSRSPEMAFFEESRPSGEQLADLSALADGTIASARRHEVESMLAASAELRLLYERERRAVSLLHTAREADRAPARLRARLQAQRPTARVRARRRLGYSGALSAALAVGALAVALVLPTGTPGAPTLSQAALLATRGSSLPPPAPDPLEPTVKLAQNVDDTYFPNWTKELGWRATGQRSDHLDGRRAVTVYYQWHDVRIAYTIVSAPALKQPAAHLIKVHGVELRVLTVDRRVVITWRRDGKTCVLSGDHVSASQLERLAAWQPSQSFKQTA